MKPTSLLPLLFTLLPTSSFAGFSAYMPNRDAKEAAETMTVDQLKSHTRFLSSDLLEGRAPASTGDRIAEEYIAAQFERIGLKPTLKEGSWLQPFELIGLETKTPKTITFWNGAKKATFAISKDFIAVSGVQKTFASIPNTEVVFVGYGIVAPEYGWDDYKDVDVKGKIILMMNSDPSDDPKLFAGKTRLYYGRWTYKYEIAVKKGAAGAFIIHSQPSAGYPWQVVQTSWSGELFSLPNTGEPTTTVKGWLTEDATKELVKLSGHDLDQLRAAAEKKDFRPVPLGTKLALSMDVKLRQVKTDNVIGLLPGSDPVLSKEVVIYTAHHDHLGKKVDAKPGEDAIYNGALDNASGVASLLSLAEAYSHLKRKPSRSILFASVAAEESGLLGSEYFAKNPPVAPGKMAAIINIDGINIWGATTDINFIGKGKSTLDGFVDSIAQMQGRVVKPDQFPDRGYFYRSDQFNLAKIGVPAAYFHSGIDMVGRPKGWGREQIEAWVEKHYHQTSDEIRPDWNYDGAMQDLALYFYLGYEVAKQKELPKWNPGDEFEAARIFALKNVK